MPEFISESALMLLPSGETERKRLRLLHLDDDRCVPEACRQCLQDAGWEVQADWVRTKEELAVRLGIATYHIVLADYFLAESRGIEVVDVLRRLRRDIPVLLVTNPMGEENVVDALRHGVSDCVLKERLSRLPMVVERVLKERMERAEKKRLAEERDRFFMLSSDLLCIVDGQGRILQLNPAWQRTLGFSIDELVQRPLAEWIHGEDRFRFFDAQRALAEGSAAVEFETRCLAANGSHRWLQWRASSVPRQPLVYTTARDITDRRQAEQSLRATEERLRDQAALLDKAHEAIWVQDLDGRILYWNLSAERLYGLAAAEAIGTKAEERLQPAEGSAPVETIWQALQEKSEWIGELAQVGRGGRKLMVLSQRTLVRTPEGVAKSVLVINSDITEKKTLEAQLFRAQRIESIGTIANGIAHDLNNVLTPILMAVDILLEIALDARTRKLLNTVQSSASHGAAMVKQILAFSKGADGEKLPIQFKHVLQQMRDFARDTFPRTIDIQTSVSPDLWLVKGDTTQLHQVLLNLCVNARDAMPTGGLMTIDLCNRVLDEVYARVHFDARPGPYVVLTVTDSGTGIPAHIIEKIFEPFFTTKEAGKGTGLGLSTVLGIVRGHAGFLNVYSEPGKGTRFAIYIPALPAEMPNPVPVSDVRRFRGRGEYILVIDDESSFREITKSILEKNNYQVITASEGAEGLARFSENADRIELVITDMMMPVMDGATTLRALRKLNPKLRMIATSGMPIAKRFQPFEDGEQVPFLLKPYSTRTLLETVHQAVSSLHPVLAP